MRYVRLALKFISLNLQKELIYRFNAFYTFVAVIMYLATFILSLSYVFEEVDSVAGYSYDELYIILMLAQIWWFVHVTTTRKNFQFVADAINKGTLDIYLLKPVSFRWLIPFLQFDFRHVPPFFLGLGLLLLKLNLADLSWWQIVGSIVFFCNGIYIVYAITAIFVSTNFWAGRNLSIFDITLEIPELIKLPIEFFPVIFREIFIFAVPIIAVLNPSFQFLVGEVDLFLTGAAIVISILLTLLSQIMWEAGLRNYTSAN